MKTSSHRPPRDLRSLLAIILVALVFCGCKRPEPNRIQGYVEGEFVYIASPIGGTVQRLSCARGEQVKAGASLFNLENGRETAAVDEAQRRLAQARATLEDARKGKRPSEIEALAAQLQQARAALVLSQKELARAEELARTAVATGQELDRARSAHDQDRQRVAQLTAELETARLGARSDQVAAAEANVRAGEAALAKAQWDLDQKQQAAPADGLIFDTVYRVGEWVPAGRPVVVLLPPSNIKVRAFVPQTRLANLQVGDAARVSIDGAPAPVEGKIRFISPRAEFTPPVIYSRESREKLVFMVEIAFEPERAARLHPGQPVDVEFAR
jgi:HlyD family secretion protein